MNPNSPSQPQEQIAQRARDIWISRGSPEGQDLEIWLLAERELAVPPSVAPDSGKIKSLPEKVTRKGRTTPAAKNPLGAEPIDAGDLQARLKRFGESAQRSPTSLDLS